MRSLGQQAVIWGYRLFLDREPETKEVILEKSIKLRGTRQLRHAFMQSEEFKRKNPSYGAVAFSGDEPRMAIEDIDSETKLQVLFEHVQDAWQHLGEKEPYWSILTSEEFLKANILDSSVLEALYDTGNADVVRVLKTLERSSIDHASLKSCLDFGCGVGRVTRWLAEHFEVVYGYDISKAHLQIAERHLQERSIRNVVLKQIGSIRDVEDMPKVDLICSLLVLQHNPPPMSAYIIRQFLRALNPGGVALFQVPTYRIGYGFSLRKYLSKKSESRAVEIHALPQSQIFDIVRQEGGRLLEVIENDATGLNSGERSNTFLIRSE